MAYAYFSNTTPDRIIVLQRLRNARDTLDALMAALKRNQKEKLLTSFLAAGSARHAETLAQYQVLAKKSGTKEAGAMDALYSSLAALTPGTAGNIHRDTIKWFLSHALKQFIVHEFKDLQKESLSRAISASETKDKQMWKEQAEEFEELWRMNADTTLGTSDLVRMMASLKLSGPRATMNRDDFVAFFAQHAASHLPERWFMDELCLKESRTFSSQMSLRFKSSRSFLSGSGGLGGSPGCKRS